MVSNMDGRSVAQEYVFRVSSRQRGKVCCMRQHIARSFTLSLASRPPARAP